MRLFLGSGLVPGARLVEPVATGQSAHGCRSSQHAALRLARPNRSVPRPTRPLACSLRDDFGAYPLRGCGAVVTIASHARGELRLASQGAERIRGHRAQPAHRRGHRFSPDRVWHRAAAQPLAELLEPGRVEITAAIQGVRVARGASNAGDDRLEATMCAVMHVLWGRATAEGSAHFATTYEQLLVAIARLAKIWGPVPPAETLAREEWVKDHRGTLYKWLDDARQAQLIAGGGVKDNREIWWRTEITVLGVPELSAEQLAAAEARIAGFPSRARKAARRTTKKGVDYAAIFAAAAPPTAAQKKRRAVARAKARYISRKENSRRPCSPSLPSEAKEAPQELPSPQTFTSPYTSLDRKGVRKRPRPGKPGAVRRLRRGDRSAHNSSQDSAQTNEHRQNVPEVIDGRQAFSSRGSTANVGPLGRTDGPPGLLGEEKALWAAEAVRIAQTARSLSRGADLSDPATLEAITVGWYVERHGLDWVAERGPHGLARAAGDQLTDVVAYYERHLAARVPGFPDSGLGALRRLAIAPAPPYERRIRQRDGRWRTITVRPELSNTIGHALTGLRMLARDMAAAEKLLADLSPTPEASNELAPPTAAMRMPYRAIPTRTAWSEDDKARRKRVRTQLTHAGGNPRHHDTLEAAELELLEREHHGLLPARYAYPSPTAMRAHRGAWMPAWYRPTPSEISPADAWNQLLAAAAGEQTSPDQVGPFAPTRWLDDTEIELWLSPLSPIELADDTLTIAGPRSYAQHARDRHHAGLQQLAQALGIARRLHITDLDDYAGGNHHAPPRPPANDPGADGTAARGRRHLRRIEHERRRLLDEQRDTTLTDTELIARRISATPDNEAWDEICDIAATRREFRSPVVVTSWLRTLLPHFAPDGTLTLTGPAHQIDNVRKHLGPQLQHLVQVAGRARAIAWKTV